MTYQHAIIVFVVIACLIACTPAARPIEETHFRSWKAEPHTMAGCLEAGWVWHEGACWWPRGAVAWGE